MGRALTLCPDRYGKALNGFGAHTRLETRRQSDFYAAIDALGPQPLPPNVWFQWYDEEGCEDRQTDDYGTPLTWLPAGAFRNIPSLVRTTLSPWNHAVLMFLHALPSATKVVLWWH